MLLYKSQCEYFPLIECQFMSKLTLNTWRQFLHNCNRFSEIYILNIKQEHTKEISQIKLYFCFWIIMLNIYDYVVEI